MYPTTPVPKDYLIKAYNPSLNQTKYFQTVGQFKTFAGSCCNTTAMNYIHSGNYNNWNLTVKPF